MTAESLRKKLKKDNAFDIAFNYCAITAFGGFGVYLFFDILFTHHIIRQPSNLIYLVPAFFILFAIYGFWQIPRDFIVVQIDSTKSMEEKRTIIDSYFTNKTGNVRVNKDSARFLYPGNIFLDLRVNIYFDEKKVIFNVHAVNMKGQSSGFIDFGMTRRAMKKLRWYLEGYL